MRRAAFFSACVVALVLLVGAPTPAQEERRPIGVSPPVGQVSTEAGRMVQDTVTVVNLSGESLSVRASLAPLEVSPDGSFRSPEDSELPSAVSWGSVDMAAFQLPAQNSRRVTAVMTPPAGTPAGGYYAAIKLVATRPGGDQVEVIHPVLIEVAGDGILTRRGRLVDVRMASTTLRSMIPVTVRLANSGNVHVVATGRLTVQDALSRTTATVALTRTPVLPERTVILTVDVPAPLLPGPFTVVANVSFGRGASEVASSVSGYSFPWWGIVAIVVVALILYRTVMFVLRWRRKRRARRAEVAIPTEIAVERAGFEDVEELTPVSKQPDAWRDAVELGPVGAEPEELEPVPTQFRPEPEEPEIESWAPALEPEEEFEPVPAESFAPEEPEVIEEEPVPEAEAPELEEPAAFTAPEPLEVPPSLYRELESLREPEPEPEAEPAMAPRPYPRAAAVRRARVALDLLTAEGAVLETKLDVGLEILQAVRGHEEVRSTVAAAYEESREGRGRVEALALALDAVDSERAPAALLEAYGSAEEPLAHRVRAALSAYPREELRGYGELIDALPAGRRADAGLG